MKHEFDNGKYTVIFDEKTGKMEALRYGEPWQDLCGNKMVYCMLSEVDSLKQQRAELLEALKNSQEAIRQLREFGSPHLLWDDIEFENKRAIKKCEDAK